MVCFGLVGWALHAAESSGKEKLKPRGCKVWAQGLLEPAASTAQSRRPSRPWTGPDLWPLAHSLSLPHQLSLRVLTSCPSDSQALHPFLPSRCHSGLPDSGRSKQRLGRLADLSVDPKWRGLVPGPAAAAHVQSGPGGVSAGRSRSGLGWRLGEGKVHVFWGVEAHVGGRTVGRGGLDQDSDGGAGSLPCQLTDVVTRLSLARCLVTERAPSRDSQSALVFLKSGSSREPIRERDLAWEGGENLSRRGY